MCFDYTFNCNQFYGMFQSSISGKGRKVINQTKLRSQCLESIGADSSLLRSRTLITAAKKTTQICTADGH